MARKLTNLQVDEVSIVDEPANKGAVIMLFKKLFGKDDSPSEAVDTLKDVIVSTLNDENVEDKEAQISKAFEAYQKAMDKEDYKSKYEDLMQKYKDMEEEMKKLQKSADNQEKEPEYPPEVKKHLDSQKEAVEKANKRVEELEKSLKRESFIKKASSYDKVPGTAEEIADLLMDTSEEVKETLEKVLNAANEALSKSFIEKGSQGEDESDPVVKIEKLAQKAVADGDYDNIHLAKSAMWEKHPEIKADYDKQREGK